MDTLTRVNEPSKARDHAAGAAGPTYEEFQSGTSVIYAMHGKCLVAGIETRSLGGSSIRFYKLEKKKPALSRSTRLDPAIWVPVHSAKEQGMRAPMDATQAEAAQKTLLSREYYFDPSQSWAAVQPQLELAIRLEGGVGLAKVASFLFVLARKQIVPTSEVAKLQEAVQRLLFRELSEALAEPIRNIEEKTMKGFKNKLLPDN